VTVVISSRLPIADAAGEPPATAQPAGGSDSGAGLATEVSSPNVKRVAPQASVDLDHDRWSAPRRALSTAALREHGCSFPRT
jgi:hypothetical protein